MRLSDFDLDSLREKVEQQDGFQIAITPIFPRQFENVRLCAEGLHKKLEEQGYSVLLDDRNQKPRNMFAVIEFLRVPHRITISGRSIEAKVFEYMDLTSGYREKVSEKEILTFLAARI